LLLILNIYPIFIQNIRVKTQLMRKSRINGRCVIVDLHATGLFGGNEVAQGIGNDPKNEKTNKFIGSITQRYISP
jgi:hypothetical protein